MIQLTRPSRARLRWAPLALAATIVAGCKGSEPSGNATGEVGGTIVVAMPGDVGTLLPGLVT